MIWRKEEGGGMEEAQWVENCTGIPSPLLQLQELLLYVWTLLQAAEFSSV